MGKYYRNDAILKKFGLRVREERERRGLSIHQFANLCDLEYSQIIRIELGKINSSISHLYLIAEKLEIAPETLVKIQ